MRWIIGINVAICILAVSIAVIFGKEASGTAAQEDSFTPVELGGTVLATCATCDPAIEITELSANGVDFAEYRLDPAVPSAYYNFFALRGEASWCTDDGGTLEMLLEQNWILRITVPDTGMVCGSTPDPVRTWLSYPNHVFLSAAAPHELAEAIGSPDAFILVT